MADSPQAITSIPSVYIDTHPNKPIVGDTLSFNGREVGFIHSFDTGPYLEGVCYYVPNKDDLSSPPHEDHCFIWAYYDKGVKLNPAFSWPNKNTTIDKDS